MPAVQRVYRILSKGCFERLEPDIGKLICPVLRGEVDGNAAPLLDTMRLTTMTQSAKGLPDKIGDETSLPLRDEVLRQLERTKWFLWHGNVFQALQVLTSIHLDLEMASWERDEVRIGKLCKTVQEFYTFIDRNRAFIPNYGERYRSGERISTGFVESTVNQVVSKRMVKKQQMRWSHRGAHLLLQIRTRVLNGDWEDVFRRWYPGFRAQTQPVFA